MKKRNRRVIASPSIPQDKLREAISCQVRDCFVTEFVLSVAEGFLAMTA
jgi:hypothetical protein